MERALALTAAIMLVAVATPAASADDGAVGAWNEDVDRAWDDGRTVLVDHVPTLVRITGETAADAVREPDEAPTRWNLGTQTGEGLRGDVNTTRETLRGAILEEGDDTRDAATNWSVGTRTGEGLREDLNRTWSPAADEVRDPGSEDAATAAEAASEDAATAAGEAGGAIHEDPGHGDVPMRWENPRAENQLEEGCGATVVYTTTPATYYVCANLGDTSRSGLWKEANDCPGLQTRSEDISGCGFVSPDTDCAANPTACSPLRAGPAGEPGDPLP